MSQVSRWTLWTAIHRYIGLTIITFLLIAAVNGCILVVEKAFLARCFREAAMLRTKFAKGI